MWPSYAESITTVPLCFGLFAFWRTRCHGRWQSADPHVRQRSLKRGHFFGRFSSALSHTCTSSILNGVSTYSVTAPRFLPSTTSYT